MTKYVSRESGSSDGFNGLSPATPWRTLSHAQNNTANLETIFHRALDVWPGESYNMSNARILDVYNSSGVNQRWILDYNGLDGDSYFTLVVMWGASAQLNNVELRNNLSGPSVTEGGRGASFKGNGFSVTNAKVTMMGGGALLRDFQGDNCSFNSCLLEHDNFNFFTVGGSPWGGGIGAAAESNPVDNYTVQDTQIFEGVGEAISAFTFSTTTPVTNVIVQDNDICAARAAAIYVNGVHGATIRRNLVLGTTNDDYHRDEPGYTGYGMVSFVESDFANFADYGNEDIRWLLNLVAFTGVGLNMSQFFGAHAGANLIAEHNTFISNHNNIQTAVVTSFGSGNRFRQNASLLLGSEGSGAAPSHTDGSGSAFTKLENFWEGGGEDSSWNHASDLSDTAWLPFKSSGWQSFDNFNDLTLEDWRPTTQVQVTQLTDPVTGINFADYQGTVNFREAGALAQGTGDPPPPPPPPPPDNVFTRNLVMRFR